MKNNGAKLEHSPSPVGMIGNPTTGTYNNNVSPGSSSDTPPWSPQPTPGQTHEVVGSPASEAAITTQVSVPNENNTVEAPTTDASAQEILGGLKSQVPRYVTSTNWRTRDANTDANTELKLCNSTPPDFQQSRRFLRPTALPVDKSLQVGPVRVHPQAKMEAGYAPIRMPLGPPAPLPPTPPSRSANVSAGEVGKNTTTTVVVPGTGAANTSGERMLESAQDVVNNTYGYFLDRGNGLVTRLIPADMLPAGVHLQNVPALQYHVPNSGMAVLPVPNGPGPAQGWDGRTALRYEQMINGYGIPSLPDIQSRIDRIVAPPHPHRPKKIWCDKWIHDGKCAFTQQGCRFKHEMPTDPETLEMLGLFSGPPAWYLRKQAEANARQLALGASHSSPHQQSPQGVHLQSHGVQGHQQSPQGAHPQSSHRVQGHQQSPHQGHQQSPHEVPQSPYRIEGRHSPHAIQGRQVPVMNMVRPPNMWRGQGVWADGAGQKQSPPHKPFVQGMAPSGPSVPCQWGPIRPPSRQ